jgi:hypothetical protein
MYLWRPSRARWPGALPLLPPKSRTRKRVALCPSRQPLSTPPCNRSIVRRGACRHLPGQGRHGRVASAIEILGRQWSESCERLSRIVAGLEDEEFFWEPCAGCWTVHRREDVRAESADGSGDWVIDYVLPEPDPAPVTTIAWRLVHVAAVNHLYWDYGFGPAELDFNLEMPGSAADARTWLRESQEPLSEELRRLTDADLDELRLTNWGERRPTNWLLTTLIHEQNHHGAEISLLRDLYRNRHTLRP